MASKSNVSKKATGVTLLDPVWEVVRKEAQGVINQDPRYEWIYLWHDP